MSEKKMPAFVLCWSKAQTHNCVGAVALAVKPVAVDTCRVLRRKKK